MKKRLVIAGLPSPKEAWEHFLGPSAHQRVVTMREVFENSEAADLRSLSLYVTQEIEREQPASILCHGVGVALTLISLLRLKKRGDLFETRVTVFNGAFRDLGLFQSTHPWKFQWMTTGQVLREVKRFGGKVDPKLTQYVPQIRSMYRDILRQRVTEKVAGMLGLDDWMPSPAKAGLRLPVQVIASSNDPFLPFEAMKRLNGDLRSTRFVELEYGHFPYTSSSERVLPLIQEFESGRV